MKTPDMLLSADDSPVTNEDACRDSVMRLELRIPSELITCLRKEILADYHPGRNEAEREKFAYESACPDMVESCKAEWRAKQQTRPLTHLITHNSWRLVLRRKSFTVNDIADGLVNSFELSFTLAFWAAHAARGNELGSGRIQGH